MIRTLVHAGLLIICAASAVAQTVQIRSGEHDGFTRLVMTLPSRVPWTIDRSEGMAVLRVDRPGLRLDPSAVFTRVGRDRLRDLRAMEAALTMELDCACDVSAFWHGTSMLVVDVADPKDTVPPAAAQVQPTVTDGERTMLSDLTEQDTQNPQRGGSVAAQLFANTVNPPDALKPQPPDMEFRPHPAPVAGWDSLQDTREALLEQFGRAASQGLLSPRSTWQSQAPSPGTPERETVQETNQPAPPAASEAQAETHINLRAESSIDRDFGASMAAQMGLQSASGCVPLRDVNVLDWGGKDTFALEVGQLRSGLTGEFDRIDPESSLRLARLYVYYGFGAEAAQVVETLPGPSRETAILLELADILEIGDAGSGRILAGQLQCEPMVALWSALSNRVLPGDAPIDSDAIQRAFATLPPHLRSVLGPGLSRRFLAAGLKDESENVLRVLNRNDATVTVKSRIAEADVAFAEAKDGRGDETLTDVVETNAPSAAEALVTQTEKRLQRGAEISYEQAQLIGSYAFENRGTDMGQTLARLQVAALAASGAFDEAYDTLTDYLAAHADDEAFVREAFLTALNDRADDMAFLKHVLAGHGGDPGRLDPDVGNAVAARLLDLGFAEKAGPFLVPVAQGNANRARKVLRAKAALSEGRPRQADVALLGLTGKDVDVLRARARSMVGEHADALDLYLAAERPENAQREAWLARDWSRIDAEGATAYVALARERLVETDGSFAPEDGVLAQNRQLLTGSDTVRSAIEDLLAANPPPELDETR